MFGQSLNDRLEASKWQPLLILAFALFWSVFCPAQTYMRIHLKGGANTDIDIGRIDSITLVDEGYPVEDKVGLAGDWLWASTEKGYYELLTFNDDRTYTGYDNFYGYGYDAATYGWYARHGALLTLFSNGIGYNRHNEWFVLGLTDNALDVITKFGRFVYYRLQPETIHLEANGKPLECEPDDSFVFADGVIACISDGKLQGLAKGTTYIQKYIASKGDIVSIKVVVE